MSDTTSTTTATPARISRADAIRAAVAGAAARDAGQPVTDCPHAADGGVVDRYYARQWRLGWAEADTA